METLHEIINADTNMRAYVVANSVAGRFNVILQDLDSGENVPCALIVNDFAAAVAKANEVVG